MKLFVSSLLFFSFVVAVSQAVRLGGAARDLISKPGECAWGLPRDGRFSSCKLGDWKIGSTRNHKAVNESEIEFSDDFDFKWKEDQLVDSQANASCSATLPANAVLYQRMTDNILYAHYRLRACARVLGNTPCSVVVKTARNEIYDQLEFRPDENLECSGSGSDNERECISECTSAIEEIKVRYVGLLPARVLVRAPDVGIVDWVEAGEFVHGDEATYNLTNIAVWFNNTIDFFPDIELWTQFGNYSVIDAVSFNCSSLSIIPGRRLGDARQFLVVSLSATEGELCSLSDLSKSESECKCDNSRNAKEVCLFSDKGFVADPAEEFYIGLETESCGCSFDNICLEEVNGEEGYFGLDWILHDEKSDDDKDDEDSGDDNSLA